MDIKLIFLSGLTHYNESRIEFWKSIQKQKDYPAELFWQQLNEVWQHYSDKIHRSINEMNRYGNSISNISLPLFTETKGEMEGHIDLISLSDLRTSLIEYGVKYDHFIYYYSYEPNIISSGNASPVKEFRIIQNIKTQMFESELATRKDHEIDKFLNFHFRWFLRKGNSPRDWLEYTKKRMPSSFSSRQKDAFLSWFENRESELLENPQSEFKMNKIKFDLTKFDLKSGVVHPYFKIRSIGNEYFVYEGATGENRFQFFKVDKNSNSGNLCKEFNEKYYVRNAKMHDFFEESMKLLNECKKEALESEKGFPAYLKYWNDCLSVDDKARMSFHIIQHFDALKEWYDIQLTGHLNANENNFLTDELKRNEIKKFDKKLLGTVENYLYNSQSNEHRNFSSISSAHASELIKFYHWLEPNTMVLDSESNGSIKPEPKKIDKEINGFQLLDNVGTESCFNVLLKGFIDKTTTKRSFNLLFDKKGLTDKINWTGTLNELARFIFLLHNPSNNGQSVCKKERRIYEIASRCFSFNSQDIDPLVLKNNNRDLKDKDRLGLLLKAINHLKKPQPATRK